MPKRNLLFKIIAISLLSLFCTLGVLSSIHALYSEHNLCYKSSPRYTKKGKRLKIVLEYFTIYFPRYKMKVCYGRKITYCNIFARDVLDNRDYKKLKGWFGVFINDYNYDVSSIFPTPLSILGTSIKEAYRRAIYAKNMGWITELTPFQAQQEANRGVVVWIVTYKYNHEAIVCPSLAPFSEDRGVLLAQAGENNGIFFARDWQAFGNRWVDKEIKYYKFNERLPDDPLPYFCKENSRRVPAKRMCVSLERR